MGSNDPMPLIIRLPHLKQFSLRGGAQSLTILEAPMLDELKLEFHIHRDLPSVTSFLSRSSWTIQRLTIGSATQLEFAEILGRTPEIEHLELRRQADLTHYMEAPFKPNSRSEGKLARHPKSLTLAASAYRTSGSPFSPQELDQLMKLVKSRNGLETLTALLSFAQARLSSLAE